MNKWDIWLARVYFEDRPEEYKQRPVVIYDDRVFQCTSFKVTSQPKSEKFHVKIKNWEKAGLTKQSWIDVSKTLSIREEFFVKKLGTLDQEDILTLLKRI